MRWRSRPCSSSGTCALQVPAPERGATPRASATASPENRVGPTGPEPNGRECPGGEGPAEWKRRPSEQSSKTVQEVLRSRNVGLRGGVLHVQRLYDPVVDDHGIPLRSEAEAEARAVHGEAECLGEVAVPVGQEFDVLGTGCLRPR